jgi:RNA polymerase sigma-70 factor (ECF subfamily)
MWDKETNLGGPTEGFPATTQGILEGLKASDGAGYRASFEEICRRYWKPVYAYVRAAWAKSNESAKDLTQAFFLLLLEENHLKAFDPSRGNFRGYLKVILRSFVGHHERALAALKRGGGAVILSLNHEAPGLEQHLAGTRDLDPDALFERVWKTELVGRSVEALKANCERRGLALSFRIFESYDLVPDAGRPTYQALAKTFQLGEGEIKNHLYRMREELRRELRSELAQSGLRDRDLEDEWNRLFGG